MEKAGPRREQAACTPRAKCPSLMTRYFFVDAKRAEQLVDNIGRMGTITYDEFVTHGASPNLDDGKTNVVPIWVGQGANKARADAMCRQKGVVKFTTIEGEKQVRMVWCYKHAGGFIDAKGTLKKEAEHKASGTRGAMKVHDKVLVKSDSLEFPIKKQLLSSAILVRQGWNCHTWGPMAKYAAQKLEKTRMTTYRRITKLFQRPGCALLQ